MPDHRESNNHDAPGPPTASGSLGTFAGVFTPSILTILGIILFLRVGYVVGAAGLPRALFIILIANGISILTSLSLSAIATNLRVKGGGDYYLISRTLGVEYGGAPRPGVIRGSGGLDVLLDLLRSAELRDLFRGPRQQPLLPTSILFLQRSAQSGGSAHLSGGDAGHQSDLRRHCGRRAICSLSVSFAQCASGALGRQLAFPPVAAGGCDQTP